MDTEEQLQCGAGYVFRLFSCLRTLTRYVYLYAEERVKQLEAF